jgi:ceramide glucosyltransferase
VALAAMAFRFVAAYVVSSCVLKAKLNWLLLPVEDLAAFCFWVGGFFGNTIVWRGRRYLLHPDGRFDLIVDVPDMPPVSNEA